MLVLDMITYLVCIEVSLCLVLTFDSCYQLTAVVKLMHCNNYLCKELPDQIKIDQTFMKYKYFFFLFRS